MNLLFRLIYITLFSRLQKPVPILGPSRTSFRCWPTDLDVLLHMNNGKYFSLMDLARVQLMIRAGMLAKFTKAGWYPVVVAETMRFKKSIELFQKFEIETVVLGWDEKAILLRQQFLRGDQILAEALVRARSLKKSGGSVAPQELLKLAEYNCDSPALEPWIAEWNRNQL